MCNYYSWKQFIRMREAYVCLRRSVSFQPEL